ncbi:MAG TPA: proton-conducting transporter membrane subunit, partial [Nitriliruptorales bacterium]
MLLVLLLHAVTALVVGLLGRRLGRRVLLLSAVAPAGALAYTVVRTGEVVGGGVVQERHGWAQELGLTIDLRLDGFGLLFWWLIAGIGVLVALYAFAYFSERTDLGRFAANLVVFAGAMLLLVAADNVLVLFVGWELTSITSYLLIGFRDDLVAARVAALQALLVTGAGGLALLAGLVLLGQAAGSYSLADILAAAPTGAPAQVGLGLVLLGAFTKSAQIPFHFWLPGAMAAPTPVSAYLHSATMVKAGVYLVARFAPAFVGEVGWLLPVVVVVAGGSMLLGGYRALRSTDLKSLLALGTVSQLGFMILLFGVGDPDLTHAGVALLLAHSLFKAALFMTVGVVDIQAGTRDLRRLQGLARRLRVTAAVTAVAAASMAGVFPLLGFVAKEAALEGALHLGGAGPVVTVTVVLGSVLTVAYGLRLLWGGFASKDEAQLVDDPVEPTEVQPAAALFVAPPLVLVALTVLLGLWVGPVDTLVAVAATSLDPGSGGLHLALWHGVNAAFLQSLAALGLGYAVYRVPGLVERVGAWTARAPDATTAYRWLLYRLNEVADRVTAVVQPGSLPVYGGVVLLTVLVLPGWVLVRNIELPTDLQLAEHPLQAVVAVLVVLAAIGSAR